MLVLKRRIDQNETIRIGDDIVITVLERQGNQIKIGIVAPRDLPVHRGEVYAAIQNERSAG